MPHVIVKLWPGKSEQQKKALANKITRAVMDTNCMAVLLRCARYLPELIELVWNGKINPGKVFDLTLPLD